MYIAVTTGIIAVIGTHYYIAGSVNAILGKYGKN